MPKMRHNLNVINFLWLLRWKIDNCLWILQQALPKCDNIWTTSFVWVIFVLTVMTDHVQNVIKSKNWQFVVNFVTGPLTWPKYNKIWLKASLFCNFCNRTAECADTSKMLIFGEFCDRRCPPFRQNPKQERTKKRSKLSN